MSRLCCLRSGLHCPFHTLVAGDDSYSKMEMVSRFFHKDCLESERDQIRRTLRNRFPRPGQSSHTKYEHSSSSQDDKSNFEPSTSGSAILQPSSLKRRIVDQHAKIFSDNSTHAVLEDAPSTSYGLARDGSGSHMIENCVNDRHTLNSRSPVDVNCSSLGPRLSEQNGQEMFEEDAVEVSQFIEICDNELQNDDLSENYFIHDGSIRKPGCNSLQNAPPKRRYSLDYKVNAKKARLVSQTEGSRVSDISTERINSSNNVPEQAIKIEPEEYEPVTAPRRSGRPVKIKKFDDYVVE